MSHLSLANAASLIGDTIVLRKVWIRYYILKKTASFALALLSVIILPARNGSGGTCLRSTSDGIGGLFAPS